MSDHDCLKHLYAIKASQSWKAYEHRIIHNVYRCSQCGSDWVYRGGDFAKLSFVY